MNPEDIARLARPLTGPGGNRDPYIILRQAFQASGPEFATVACRLLLSNPDKGEDGLVEPFYYQAPFIADIVRQEHNEIWGLFSTGCGKTYGVAMAESLRMFFEPEYAAVISYVEEQTSYIREGVRHFFETGHPILRACLEDSNRDEVVVRRPSGDKSHLFCKTANVNNEGKTLLGLQGLTAILLDEAALIPSDIFNLKIDRITAPQKRERLLCGITTTQDINFVYDKVEAEKLPRRENCDPTRPHVTARGAAVYKGTWRHGVKAGRYSAEYIEDRHKAMGEQDFGVWYECDWPLRSEGRVFSADLLRSMVDP